MDKDTMKVIAIYIVIIVGWNLFYKWFANRMRSNMNNSFNSRYRQTSNNSSDSMSWKKAAKAFGTNVKSLKKMTKAEIKKLYRKKAMKAHPDTGGSEDDFKNLNNAYNFAYAA